MSPPPAPNPIRDSLIARADALREGGAPAEARDLYRLVLDRHPGHGPALAGLGRILLGLGQPTAALESLGAAVAADPTRLDWLA
ncbi:tetratricopeptide repeat protein, partial [Rhodospirillum rubrum]